MEIITGYTSENHVTSADDASLYRGILGQDDYVLEVGSKFAATIIDNNTVRVMDGDLVIQGHQARIRANDYNEVTIDNGTPGQKRNDLIVARYLKNTETGIESITLEVVKGTPGTAAFDPEITQEDLKVGGTQRDYPLYRVELDGISLTNLTKLFNVVPTIATHMAEIATDAHAITPACRVVNSANISVPNNVVTALTFDTERVDTDNIHEIGGLSARLTARTQGLYLITATLSFETNATGTRMARIVYNDTVHIARLYLTNPSDQTGFTLTALYKMNSNDYLKVECFQNSGGSLNIVGDLSGGMSFSMVKVG